MPCVSAFHSAASIACPGSHDVAKMEIRTQTTRADAQNDRHDPGYFDDGSPLEVNAMRHRWWQSSDGIDLRQARWWPKPSARQPTQRRSVRQAIPSSGKDRTCIFSITLWRWALMVRSVQPSARAACLLVLPRMTRSKTSRSRGVNRRETSANACPAWPSGIRVILMCEGPFNCAKKLVRRYGLGQEVLRTRLDGLHRDRNIG